MSLEQSLRRFYVSDKNLTSLDFGVPGIPRITPAGFRLLSSRVVATDHTGLRIGDQEGLGIVVNAAMLTSPRMQAGYMRQQSLLVPADTMVLRSANIFNSNFGRSVLYHESIHALLDANRVNIPRWANEGIAYLGTALYLLSCGISADHEPPGLNEEELRLFNTYDQLFVLAGRMMDRGRVSGAPMMATTEENEELREIARNIPNGMQIATMNGIAGRGIENGSWN